VQTVTPPIGGQLREWRQRRRLSQLALACDAEISTKHLSFVETGRSLPSRDMILHLAERLDVPLRERNKLLIAAGYAAVFSEKPLQDPALAAARNVIDIVLAGYEPYPALAIDRHWTVTAANKALTPLLDGADPSLLCSPVNALRVGLHPAGLAPRIANYDEWRAHLQARLQRQVDLTGDPVLVELLREIADYPAPVNAKRNKTPANSQYSEIVVPLQLITDEGMLSLLSMTTVFGTPVDITLSELALEAFLPADAATADALRRLTAGA
jgi:transcriptional regulator with XRE-family HTH domain